MTDENTLGGRRILVVEDDYFLASDAARALTHAGADVLGPCPNEKAAYGELERERPDAAVLDIHLGEGPSYKLAKALRGLSIPFLFVTGYDRDVIPEEFAGVQRLIKPVPLSGIVEAVAKLLPA